jgi:hypothetical protein
MIEFKVGQRWEWKNKRCTAILEVIEPTSFNLLDAVYVKCKLLQVVSGATWVQINQIVDWGTNGNTWTYLEGQDKPI